MISSSLTYATSAPEEMARFCKAVGDETRLAILRKLSLTDLRGGDMVQWLDIPHNALSYHLKYLRDLGLVRDHRSSADARDIYYQLDLRRLRGLYAALGNALQAESNEFLESLAVPGTADTPLRVLFLCTHNSARSQLAQGIAQQRGGIRIAAFSAGSEPTEIRPEALALLRARGVNTTGYQAKSLAEFADQTFDYVVTVCDRVREVCPTFPGDPVHLHWSIPDPVQIDDDADRQQAFSNVVAALELRIEHFMRVTSRGGKTV
jgi:protein-tyrosine-phosphatase/DNA-binding transcriptional ArsR family regulator